MSSNIRNVLITGARSRAGIGAVTARTFARDAAVVASEQSSFVNSVELFVDEATVQI